MKLWLLLTVLIALCSYEDLTHKSTRLTPPKNTQESKQNIWN